MDFINVRDEEYFGSFDQNSFLDSCPEDSTDYNAEDDKNLWEWEEREINGDIAFIPLTTRTFDADVGSLSTSPPSKDHFHKIICDWQQLINVDAPVTEDFPTDTLLSEANIPADPPLHYEPDLNAAAFDLTRYVNEPPTADACLAQEPVRLRDPRTLAGGKKIDLKAQCYVIGDGDSEDDHVDVETVSENGSPTVLEAGDVDSLLEQFEASEDWQGKCLDLEVVDVKSEVVEMEVSSEEQKPACDSTKSKQILEALPEELIKRIKESGKRKTISVIPPIPNKKRCGPTRSLEIGNQITRNRILKMVSSEAVQLDHDYCCSPSPYPKHPKKDSGFESAEEDETRTILRNQPTVKNADGTLMVSLLKANTIRPNAEVKQKRKLNLAEYKKRKDIVVPKAENSETVSVKSEEEDENTKRIRHQEKLMKMAMELLNTQAKNSSNKPEVLNNKVATMTAVTVTLTPPPPIKVQPEKPPDMDVKTLVSVGVNTENTDVCTAPVVEEIKPLLQNAKISTHSLINSVIENIPKVKNNNKPTSDATQSKNKSAEEHGENKTIVYLPKDRPRPVTSDAAVQTVTDANNRRRPGSRSSSSSERKSRYRRKRSTSRSSRYSSAGSYSVCSSSSSRSSSRSRSRSVSPWRQGKRQQGTEHERIEEVEERRVIYVGRISSSMTREDLRRRFQAFGAITRVSVHFRERGDNYGFVTFLNKLDAYEAIEHGNDDPLYPKYDLSFGGRRMFCKTSYSDLDNVREEMGYYPSARPVSEDSFDNLLRIAQEKLRKRKL